MTVPLVVGIVDLLPNLIIGISNRLKYPKVIKLVGTSAKGPVQIDASRHFRPVSSGLFSPFQMHMLDLEAPSFFPSYSSSSDPDIVF